MYKLIKTMTTRKRDNLKKLIGDGSIEKAINELLKYNLDDDHRNEVIATQAKYNSLQKEIRLDTLPTADQHLQSNKINNTLLSQIDRASKILKDADSIGKDEDVEVEANKVIEVSETKLDHKEKEEKQRHSSQLKRIITIIGILGSIASIIALWNTWSADPTLKVKQLTIFVTDAKGNAVLKNEGELNIPIGNRILNRKIESDGRTNFADITADNIGDTITIGLKAEGWEIDGTNTFAFQGEPIKLTVKRDDSLGKISGSVMTRDGQSFIDSARITINTDTAIYSKNGLFEIILPQNMRIDKKTEQYRLTVIKDGYETETQHYEVKSSSAEFRLKKIK